MKFETAEWVHSNRSTKFRIVDSVHGLETDLIIGDVGGKLIMPGDIIRNVGVTRGGLFNAFSGPIIRIESVEVFRFSGFLFPALEVVGFGAIGKLKVTGKFGRTTISCRDLAIEIKHSLCFNSATGVFGPTFGCMSEAIPVLFGFLIREFGEHWSAEPQ